MYPRIQETVSATQLAEKTVAYAKAETAYNNALRAEMPEMTDIATGRPPRPSDLDKFPAAFIVAGEKQERAVDEETSKDHCDSPVSGCEQAETHEKQAQPEQHNQHHWNRDSDHVLPDQKPPHLRQVGGQCQSLRQQPALVCAVTFHPRQPVLKFFE